MSAPNYHEIVEACAAGRIPPPFQTLAPLTLPGDTKTSPSSTSPSSTTPTITKPTNTSPPTGSPSCYIQNQDPDQGITARGCKCGTVTLPFLSIAGSVTRDDQYCSYTAWPTGTVQNPITVMSTAYTSNCKACTLVGGIADQATCTPVPNCTPTSSTPSSTSNSAGALQTYGSDGELIGSCLLISQKPGYQEPSYEYTHEWYDQCLNVCNGIAGFDVKNSSITCVGYGDKTEQPSMPNMLMQPGHCSCNNPIINYVANMFIQALIKLGEAIKWVEYLFDAFEAIAMIGLAFIPGVGEALDAGLVAAISAAKLAEYTYDAARIAAQAFEQWASKIPNASKWPQTVWDTLKGVPDDRLPGGWQKPDYPKGQGKPGDEGCKE